MSNKGQKLYKEVKKIIPGGTQIFSKRPEIFLPDNWPSYYKKAKGIEVWDLDDKKYYDATHNGLGASILGYADPDVNSAVNKAISSGSLTTLNCPEEYELAKLLLKYHPWADMVRYARSGGEAVSIAIRVARSFTKKEIILFCGYHGWSDWYLAANLSDDKALDGQLLPGLSPLGVPRSLNGTCFPFKYNDINSLEMLVDQHKGEIASIIMEPTRNLGPEKGFLEAVREISKSNKIPLIFDEVTSGFRVYPGGIHQIFEVEPDIAVFAKAIANGFPMAAIIGKKFVMSVAQDSFISSAFWSEKVGLVAAIKTIEKCIENKVYDHVNKIGQEIQRLWIEKSEEFNLKINVFGIPPLSIFSFKGEYSIEKHTLFTQEMLKLGFLASNSFYVLWKHDDKFLKKYSKSLDIVFNKISNAEKNDNIADLIDGPLRHSGFKRLT